MKKIFFIILVLLFTGCASKKELSNQTALFWHNKIYKDLSNMNLDGADDAFTSLEVEHPNSKYVPIDMLILYTDGVTEAMNSKKELFSKERLKDVIAHLKEREVKQVVYKVREAIKLFVEDAPQSDDITMLVVKFKG